MNTPDVTLVQKLVGAVIAVLAALLPVLTAFGVSITTEQITAILGFATALGSAFVIADAVIRNGRSRALGNPESIREMEQPAPPAINQR